MKKFLFILLLLTGSLLQVNTIFAQELIKGYIKADDTGESMEFVSVSIKGTTRGTASNIDGYYEIRTIQPDDVIRFNYMGYEMLEVPAGKLLKSPDVTLKALTLSIQELVVKAFQEEDVIRGCLRRVNIIYPSQPVMCKAQIKDLTIENKKIQSYYDFSSDIWVKSFNRKEEEKDPITMRVLNVTAASDRYTDSIPVRPYVIYDKTVRNIITENYALRTILTMMDNNLLKWHSKKETLGGEDVWVMNFESKESQNDSHSQATVDKVSGIVIAAAADSAILRVELTEDFSNYTNISHFVNQNKQRIQCVVNFLQQQQISNFRRVGNKVYPEYTKTTIQSDLKYSGKQILRQQLSLIFIGEIETQNVKRIPKKEAYNPEMPLYRQITVGNESWRTINSLPLTKEERSFIDEHR